MSGLLNFVFPFGFSDVDSLFRFYESVCVYGIKLTSIPMTQSLMVEVDGTFGSLVTGDPKVALIFYAIVHGHCKDVKNLKCPSKPIRIKSKPGLLPLSLIREPI